MPAHPTPRPNGTAAASARAARPRAGSRGAPPVSWALVFAGLLAGGVLSFGAGLMTGTQMTTVAYRGVLPGSVPPAASAAGADDRRDGAPAASATRTPRDRQVATNTHAPLSASASAPQAAVNQAADANRRARPHDTVALDVASLVNLPQRDHWKAPTHAGPAPNAPSATGGTQADNAPPPPPPKPQGGAPQRLTPMGGAGGAETRDRTPGGDAAALRSVPAMAPGPIWQVAAPSDGGEPAGQWQLFDQGLAPSLHWPPNPAGERAAPAALAAQPAGRYSVQVGAFRKRANALEQAARMTDAGYTPRIVHQQATQSRLFMVRLGAFPDRAGRQQARHLAV